MRTAPPLTFGLVTVFLLIVAPTSFAVLSGPGDIAFVGYNADNNDDFAFVVLINIGAGETIRFTDREWDGASFNTGEGDFTWTAPIGGVPRGTVVTINTLQTTATASVGTLAGTFSGLGGSNEALFALLGTTASPTAFLAAFSNDGDAGFTTLSGTGLTVGTTAVDFDGVATDHDIFEYTGARTGENDYSDYLPLINNPSNWVTQNGSGDQDADSTPPDLPFNTMMFDATIPVELMSFSID